MPRPLTKHYVFTAYKGLVDEFGIDPATAISQLEELYPALPVALIVNAEGDMTKTLEALVGEPVELPRRADNGRVDPRRVTATYSQAIKNRLKAENERLDAVEDGIQQMRDNNGADTTTSQAGEPESASGQPSEDHSKNAAFNDALRTRARSNAGTLSHGELMGEQEQGAYDPSADPFRQRFADREAQRQGR